MPEPVGVMAIICPDENPLLGFISTVIPAIAMGNNVVAVSYTHLDVYKRQGTENPVSVEKAEKKDFTNT